MNFITLGKRRSDGAWVLLMGPPHNLQAQRDFLTGIGLSDSTYSEARIIELGVGVKRIFYDSDETITITASDKTITYGANKPSSFAVTWSKSIPASYYTGTLKTTCDYSKGSNAGTYPIIPSGLTATDKYALAFVNGTLTVAKAELTLTVANAEMVEGGAAPEFSFTGTGFVNDEDATDLSGSAVYIVKDALGEIVADVTLAAPGTYSVHLSGITSDNYEITLVAGTLTITESGS